VAVLGTDNLMIDRGGTLYKALVSALSAFLFASPVVTGNLFAAQPSPTAKTATGTLTIAELLTQIITVTSATAVSH
jgi:hypothetical protein